MATEAGELIVKISADVSDMKSQLQSMNGQMQGLGITTIAFGNIMADALKRAATATVEFARDSVMAFAQHEQAVTRLSIAVGHDAAQALETYANELQKTTAYSDDAILSLENQLAQYGIYPGSVREATKALLNFAAATGKDLPEAGQMLARAMAGQSRELKNYGIDVNAAASRSQNLDTVIHGLNQRFSGAAETLKGTTIGAIESLSNRFEDLKKRIGEDLMPVAKTFLEWANDVLTPVELLIRSGHQYADTVDAQKQKLADLTAQMKAQVTNGVQVTKTQQDQIKALVEHIRQLEKSTRAHADNKGAVDREIAAIRQLKDELANLEQQEAHLSEITKLETEKRIKASQVAWEANASFSDQLKVKMADDMSHNTSAWVNMTDGMINSFADGTARMIVEGGKFSDVIQNLWQMLAEQVIAQILKMIAEWLVWQALTGGAGGGFMAFAGHAAGGGMINEPSMIVGLRTGSRILAGEAGPEEIVPRGSSGNVAFASSGMNEMGGGNGGGSGNITINISGQFIDGSPARWQRMIQERILPELRRSSMKNPVGVITRKRGAMA